MENKNSNLNDLSLEQIEQLIEQTKQEVAALQQEINTKTKYLAELIFQLSN